MASIFESGSPHTARLGAIVSEFEQLQMQKRAIAAREFELYAQALSVTERESVRVSQLRSGLADGTVDADGGGDTVKPAGAVGIDAAGAVGVDAHGLSGLRALAVRSARAEIATALHVTEASIDRGLSDGDALATRFPGIRGALAAGSVDVAHVKVMLDAAVVIGVGVSETLDARRAGYEQAILEVAVGTTPNRLRPIARRLAEQYAEKSIDERHADARKHRRVSVTDCGDGMADLTAHLPAVEAFGIYDRMSRAGKLIAEAERHIQADIQQPEHEAAHNDSGASKGAPTFVPRTLNEIRTDLFTDILLRSDLGFGAVSAPPTTVSAEVSSGEPLASGASGAGTAYTVPTVRRADAEKLSEIRPQLQVTVPIEVLRTGDIEGYLVGDFSHASSSTAPTAELAGSGPIDTATARTLAGTAEAWTVTGVTPDGDVVSVDRYRPSAQMRRILAVRDQHCRFFGCRAPVSRCDIDHTVDAQHGGPTSTDNLAHLCRGHHTMKHHGGWRVVQDSHGVLTWSSPTGRTHHDQPSGVRSPGARALGTLSLGARTSGDRTSSARSSPDRASGDRATRAQPPGVRPFAASLPGFRAHSNVKFVLVEDPASGPPGNFAEGVAGRADGAFGGDRLADPANIRDAKYEEDIDRAFAALVRGFSSGVAPVSDSTLSAPVGVHPAWTRTAVLDAHPLDGACLDWASASVATAEYGEEYAPAPF